MKVTLMSNDARPLNGENIAPGRMMTISKVTPRMRPVKFLAVESATEKRLLINGMDSVNVSPSKKQIVTPLMISGALYFIVTEQFLMTLQATTWYGSSVNKQECGIRF